jgi:tRNA1(Val) A37 N6-methylase TrmN6
MNETSAITEDAFLGGRLLLRQPGRGHRAGHDAILLAAATSAQAGDRVVDFGAGVGTAGLAVARRVEGVDLALVEIDPDLAALAEHNAAVNALPARVIVLDISAGAAVFSAAGLAPDSADSVLMNPPFNDSSRHRSSPDLQRRLAHQASESTLETWVHAARRILKPGGTLTMIWRAEGLLEVLTVLEKGFGSVRCLAIHAKLEAPAIRIIVAAVKGGRAPLMLCSGLNLNDESGSPDLTAQAILRGERSLLFSQT